MGKSEKIGDISEESVPVRSFAHTDAHTLTCTADIVRETLEVRHVGPRDSARSHS